jgi:hypothetical protein
MLPSTQEFPLSSEGMRSLRNDEMSGSESRRPIWATRSHYYQKRSVYGSSVEGGGDSKSRGVS